MSFSSSICHGVYRTEKEVALRKKNNACLKYDETVAIFGEPKRGKHSK
jgi:hypothetical protein